MLAVARYLNTGKMVSSPSRQRNRSNLNLDLVWFSKRSMRTALSLLLGFYGCGKNSKNDGNYSEALGKDASPHQQLGLPGFPLVEGTETIEKRPCCSQTT